MPEVSVIVPSYNHAAYIQQALRSVLDQSLSDLELIVVDDGSTDETLRVLDAVKDPRLTVVVQENRGAHAALNRGLALATAPILAILNSDDSYHPSRLKRLVAILRGHPAVGLAGSYLQVMDSDSKSLGVKHGYHDLEPWFLENARQSFRAGDDLQAALTTENYWATTSNFVFTRTLWQQIGGFRPLRFAHDWDFALRASAASEIHMVPEPLLNYRIHAANTIRQDKAAMVFEICWVLAVHLPAAIEQDWFRKEPEANRIRQLLNSVYAYECDRVLSVMLAQGIALRPDEALRLLDPASDVRATYLADIRERLARQTQPSPTWSRRVARRVAVAARRALGAGKRNTAG